MENGAAITKKILYWDFTPKCNTIGKGDENGGAKLPTM